MTLGLSISRTVTLLFSVLTQIIDYHPHPHLYGDMVITAKPENRRNSRVVSFDSEGPSYSTKVPSDLFLTYRKCLKKNQRREGKPKAIRPYSTCTQIDPGPWVFGLPIYFRLRPILRRRQSLVSQPEHRNYSQSGCRNIVKMSLTFAILGQIPNKCLLKRRLSYHQGRLCWFRLTVNCGKG